MIDINRHFKLPEPDAEIARRVHFVKTIFYQWASQLQDALPICEEANIALIKLESSMNFAINAIERGPQNAEV